VLDLTEYAQASVEGFFLHHCHLVVPAVFKFFWAQTMEVYATANLPSDLQQSNCGSIWIHRWSSSHVLVGYIFALEWMGVVDATVLGTLTVLQHPMFHDTLLQPDGDPHWDKLKRVSKNMPESSESPFNLLWMQKIHCFQNSTVCCSKARPARWWRMDPVRDISH
jgi:hypothetical protein